VLDAPDAVSEAPEVDTPEAPDAPEAYLPPNLERGVDGPGAAWTIESDAVDADGTLVVDLRWSRDDHPDLPAIRAAVLQLIGRVAGSVTAVHQHGLEDGISFEVVTGMHPDADVETDGHTLRLRLHGPT